MPGSLTAAFDAKGLALGALTAADPRLVVQTQVYPEEPDGRMRVLYDLRAPPDVQAKLKEELRRRYRALFDVLDEDGQRWRALVTCRDIGPLRDHPVCAAFLDLRDWGHPVVLHFEAGIAILRYDAPPGVDVAALEQDVRQRARESGVHAMVRVVEDLPEAARWAPLSDPAHRAVGQPAGPSHS